MKVSVITRHAITNYGSLLQTYATQRAIELLGHECMIIDYIRKGELPSHLARTNLSDNSNWNTSFLRKLAYFAIKQPENVLAGRRFAYMRKSLLNLTRSYSSLEELELGYPDADVYMTGSDQVWGPTGGGIYDYAYTLSFVGEGARRIAYASSFGRTNIPEEAWARLIEGLEKYERICVREDTAVRMLRDRTGIFADQVLDPTLLLTGDEWKAFAKPKKRDDYILVYQVHDDPAVGEYAQGLAKEKKLPLIRISPMFHQAPFPGKLNLLPDPSEFVSQIDGANLLVTDSFHGTAFAINLNTPFVGVLPKDGTSSRNASILRLTGLEKRVLSAGNDEPATNAIDWEMVNAVLARERDRSLTLLKEMIEGVSL